MKILVDCLFGFCIIALITGLNVLLQSPIVDIASGITVIWLVGRGTR